MKPRLKIMPRLPRRRVIGGLAARADDVKPIVKPAEVGFWRLGGKLNVPLIIEAFSLVTAAAFVLSAIGNAVIFWAAWNLNYFMVATPTDVVMSGFVIFGGLLALYGLSVLIELVATAYVYILQGRLGLNGRQTTGWGHRALRVALVIPFLAVSSHVLILVISISTSIKAAIHTESGMPTYPTGLKIVSAPQIDPDCRGGPVLWMGSAAGVVECKSVIRVFHELDGIVTEPLMARPKAKDLPSPRP